MCDYLPIIAPSPNNSPIHPTARSSGSPVHLTRGTSREDLSLIAPDCRASLEYVLRLLAKCYSGTLSEESRRPRAVLSCWDSAPADGSQRRGSGWGDGSLHKREAARLSPEKRRCSKEGQ
jgi:hypothetical protein